LSSDSAVCLLAPDLEAADFRPVFFWAAFLEPFALAARLRVFLPDLTREFFLAFFFAGMVRKFTTIRVKYYFGPTNRQKRFDPLPILSDNSGLIQ
jgi:hypothetical protein